MCPLRQLEDWNTGSINRFAHFERCLPLGKERGACLQTSPSEDVPSKVLENRPSSLDVQNGRVGRVLRFDFESALEEGCGTSL